MNKEEDYASDSDESDEDFCLENENDADSGDEEDEDESESESDDEDDADAGASKKQTKSVKGKKKDKSKEKRISTETKGSAPTARSTRQTETKQNERETAEKDELESDEEADKSRSDALWADFLGDVGGGESKPTTKPKRSPSPAPAKKVENEKRSPTTKPATEATEPASMVKSSSSAKENQERQPATGSDKATTASPRGFGGGKRPASGAGGGLGSLLNQLGKKKKMSVLEKSQMDWKAFKSDEGIDEELRTHNKGKDG